MTTTTSLVAFAGTVGALRVTKEPAADVKVELGEPTKDEIAAALAADSKSMQRLLDYVARCNAAKAKQPKNPRKTGPYKGTRPGAFTAK